MFSTTLGHIFGEILEKSCWDKFFLIVCKGILPSNAKHIQITNRIYVNCLHLFYDFLKSNTALNRESKN